MKNNKIKNLIFSDLITVQPLGFRVFIKYADFLTFPIKRFKSDRFIDRFSIQSTIRSGSKFKTVVLIYQKLRIGNPFFQQK